MKIREIRNRRDLDLLLRKNWKKLRENARLHGKRHVWLVQWYNGYYNLRSTRYRSKPTTRQCWYLGAIGDSNRLSDFNQATCDLMRGVFVEIAA